jgi:hypothetical protein
VSTKPSVKVQVGGGLFIAGLILALPGLAQLLRGDVAGALGLELIPAVMIIAGRRLKRSGDY